MENQKNDKDQEKYLEEHGNLSDPGAEQTKQQMDGQKPRNAQEKEPEKTSLDKKLEQQEKNKNWAEQRDFQARPRGYNETLDSENIENQNTQAADEQSNRPVGDAREQDDPKNDEKEGHSMVGDQATKRQQSRNKGSQQNENRDSKM